jgi:hypothetical protein
LTIGCDVVEAQGVIRLVVAMEDLGGEIQAIGPDHCACLGIDSDLREVIRIVERRHHRRGQLTRDVVDVTDNPVVKQQPHDMGAEDRDADDDWKVVR